MNKLVRIDRVMKKLPCLLTNEASTDPKGHKRHNQLAYRLAQLHRHDPAKCQRLTCKLEAALIEWEKALGD